jgi:predicted glycoside hydrolase/deacetylase ChbG (UPF0249 family)
MRKRIVLCADDYGQAPAVSDGILALLAAGRLSATSCLVNQPDWPASAAKLIPFDATASLGLHLNLTDGKPLSALYQQQVGQAFMSLSQLLVRSLLSMLNPKAITAEIHAQLDAFETAMGFLPRFIDGHQHIHHLPVIRRALLDVYQARMPGGGIKLRAVTLKGGGMKGIKRAVIHYTGGRSFAARLDALHLPHNTSFEGIYDFANADQYRTYFQQFLQQSADLGLIMCHPGLQSEDTSDPIHHARWLEYQYFISPDFLTDCAAADIAIVPFHVSA